MGWKMFKLIKSGEGAAAVECAAAAFLTAPEFMASGSTLGIRMEALDASAEPGSLNPHLRWTEMLQMFRILRGTNW